VTLWPEYADRGDDHVRYDVARNGMQRQIRHLGVVHDCDNRRLVRNDVEGPQNCPFDIKVEVAHAEAKASQCDGRRTGHDQVDRSGRTEAVERQRLSKMLYGVEPAGVSEQVPGDIAGVDFKEAAMKAVGWDDQVHVALDQPLANSLDGVVRGHEDALGAVALRGRYNAASGHVGPFEAWDELREISPEPTVGQGDF